MITYDNFKKCINTIVFLNDISIDENKNKVLYGLLKEDFDDASFSAICKDICKNENLFGKYPTPNMFYSKKSQSEKNILVEEGSFYLDDTMPAYKAVLSNLTQEQADDVCFKVWNWIMKTKRGEYISQDFVIERLRQFISIPILNEEEKIEDENIKELLLTAVKKIGA